MQRATAIAIEEAKKMIEEYGYFDMYSNFDCGYKNALIELIERLEKLSVESSPQDNGWIMVSERFPKTEVHQDIEEQYGRSIRISRK